MDKLARYSKDFRKNFKKTPSKYRLLGSSIIFLVLLVILPISLWGLMTGDFDIRRAASGEPTPPPSVCTSVDKMVYVTPPGGPGNCHDLQTAIDSVDGAGYTVQLAAGRYVVPNLDAPESLRVVNKDQITIQGDPSAGSDSIILEFFGNRGGILIENSSGILELMQIIGRTSNGLVRLKNSDNFVLVYLHLEDQSASTVQINNCSGIQVLNSEVKSGAVAIYSSSSDNLRIEGNIIADSSHGFESGASSGEIKYNLFNNNHEQAIYLMDPVDFTIENNTLVNSDNTDGRATFLVTMTTATPSAQINFRKNIVAWNKRGVQIDGAQYINYLFELNDIWNEGGNYFGVPGQTGQNGNISANPLFGEDWCLTRESPAIYGYSTDYEYMGYRGPCEDVYRPYCVRSDIVPPTGPAPLTVTLHGGGSGPPPGIDGYQWDFENDGVWDTEVDILPIAHTYTEPGTYYPKYRVHSPDGEWSDTCDYAYPVVVCGSEGDRINVTYGDRCCQGLRAISEGFPDSLGGCGPVPIGAAVCTWCGTDDQCGPGENYCNCPEDCQVEVSSLQFKLKFAGVTSRPTDDSDRQVSIYATSLDGGPNLGSTSQKIVVPLTVDDQGVYHGRVEIGSQFFGHHYRLRVKGPKHLQAVFPDVLFQAGELDLTDQLLRPGDLDGNGRIDATDIKIISDRIFSTEGMDIEMADVNFDGRIDITDRTLVLNTLSIQYDPD